MEMHDVILLVATLLAVAVGSADAIRCKCTKESETVRCVDGVCDTEVGSCLMLDHPTMGVHYTCHTRGLKDGTCHNRTSKSGVSVKICGCNEPDFCNFAMWPDKTARSLNERRQELADDDAATSSSLSIWRPHPLLLFSALLLVQTVFVQFLR